MSRGNATLFGEARTARRHPGGRRSAMTGTVRFAVAAVFVVLTAACDQKMANQPAYEPLQRSEFFPDNSSARPFVDGTVARGQLRENSALFEGKIGGQLVTTMPVAVDEKLLRRGQERYDIYCSMCHGAAGYGNGMVVQRGYRRPPSFHTSQLRNEPVGHYFDVITNGYGSMPPYRTMIRTEDRWAIIAYIRALQLSQNARAEDAAPAAQSKLSLPGASR
jgi:mono/diheme cytochrome c family protein